MSDELKAFVCSLIKLIEKIAAQTANPVDDIICKMLKAAFGCK